jgi:phospholipid/cholesterol/gamma-HCH transport system substrate-binding protein
VLSKKNTDLKVGITVLIGIIVLLLGIGWAKDWHFGGVHNILHARFPTAGGIETGDPVFIRGIKHGVVTIVNSPPGKDVDITMDIDQSVGLHKNAMAHIMMLELMSGKKVEIEEGTDGMFDPVKDTLQGFSNGDLSSLVDLLNSLSGTLPAITKNVDTVLRNLTDFFDNGKFKAKAYSAIDDADATLKDLRNVLGENRNALKRTIDQTDVLTRELNSTIVSMRPGAEALVDSMRVFVRKAGMTLSGADSLLASLNDMLAQSKDKKSFLYKITSDADFANRFDSLLISGHKLIEQIRYDGVNANIRFFNSAKPVK